MLLFDAIQLIIQMYTLLLRLRLNLALEISQGSATTYFRWSGQFRHILSAVCSGTTFPIFIEMGSYL